MPTIGPASFESFRDPDPGKRRRLVEATRYVAERLAGPRLQEFEVKMGGILIEFGPTDDDPKPRKSRKKYPEERAA
ncbi:MAG: hypothetical protein AB1486_18650 [Planctomycetota bacterium]